jgi:hypothetical protein
VRTELVNSYKTSTPLPRNRKSVYQLFWIACSHSNASSRSMERKGNKPKHQNKVDLVQEEHINFVGLVTEELPTIPQVVVIDLTMNPFQTGFYRHDKE